MARCFRSLTGCSKPLAPGTTACGVDFSFQNNVLSSASRVFMVGMKGDHGRDNARRGSYEELDVIL